MTEKLHLCSSSVLSFLACCQVLIQGLQDLNRAVHQDVVAVQLLPRSQWVAPSSVVLQDDGAAKDDNEDEDEEDKAVNFTITERKSDCTMEKELMHFLNSLSTIQCIIVFLCV